MAQVQTSRIAALRDWLNTGLRKLPAWPLYILAASWMGWLFYLAATGGLGVDPIEELELAYGEMALKLIVIGLAVTPLRQVLGVNLLKFRRAIGVSAFFFVLAHLMVWALLDVQQLSAVISDIAKRPYVTIGMAGFLALLPLAITSNNLSLRKMGGAAWRKLHKLTYAAALLGVVHYIWLSKGFQLEPMVYLVIILGLLAMRVPAIRQRVAL